MKKNSQILSSLLISASLLTLVSCGGGSGSSGASPLQTNSSQGEELDQAGDEGIYRAVLKPLNKSLNLNTTGTVEIKIKGDDVVMRSNVIGAPAGVKHLQNILVGDTCPDETSDANGDSVIDIKETMARAGSFLIPMDSDLSAQLNGIDYGPIANSSGSYVYKRSTSFTELVSDLQMPDPDPLDPIVKLPAGYNELSLKNRVVIVHGVKSSTTMPDTVSSVEGVPRELLMPIACGQLVRVSTEEVIPVETVEPEVTSVSGNR